MVTLVGLSGSLRAASFNTALLRAAAEEAPAGVRLQVETVHGIPLYDADVEIAEGLPPRVALLKATLTAAAGIVIATPEYNNSVPGVLKNAVDWLSRPPSDIKAVFGGKPVALLGATPGGFGTNLAQAAWLPVLRALGARTWNGGKLLVTGAATRFDDAGRLTDDAIRERLRTFLAGFAAFAEGPGS